MTVFDLAKLARLARLELSSAEAAAFAPQMEKILGLMGELEKLPLAAAEPLRPGAQTLATRADAITPSLPPAGALRGAPGRAGALFTVPRTVNRTAPNRPLQKKSGA